MMLTRENSSAGRRKVCSSASFSTTDSVWPCLGPNLGLEGDRDTTKCAL